MTISWGAHTAHQQNGARRADKTRTQRTGRAQWSGKCGARKGRRPEQREAERTVRGKAVLRPTGRGYNRMSAV